MKVELNRDKYSDECQAVQLRGFGVCENCGHKGIEKGDNACSGMLIRKTGKNSLGHTVPIQKLIKN